MKVNRRALYGALAELVRVVDPKASLPILSHVLLQAVAGVLTIKATDLKRTLTCQLPVEGEIETCLPAKLLANLIKPEGKSDAGDVVIEPIDDVSCAVTFDGLSSRLAAMSPEMFPTGPAKQDADWSLLALWPVDGIREALGYVLPAASKDDSRPHLNAVCFDLDRIVTTDGHRLHMARLPSKLPEPVLLSLDAAKTLGRLLKKADQVILARTGDVVRARVGEWQLDAKLVDASFPPYEKVIPSVTTFTTTVDHALFTKALARVSRLTKAGMVRLTVNGQIAIATSDPDLGNAAIDVPVIETSHEGDDLVMGLNPAYLRDAVSTKEEIVTLHMSGATDAVRIELGEGKSAVVMPTRL